MPAQLSSQPIVLEIRGLGHVPGNFKNRKRAILDRHTGKMRTLTDPKVKKWMDKAAHSIASQLHLRCLIDVRGIATDQQLLSWIQLSMPLDDSLVWIELGYVRGQRVKKGEEGAVITIEKL